MAARNRPPAAANTPLSTYAPTFTRRTGTPWARAASSSLPIAKIPIPNAFGAGRATATISADEDEAHGPLGFARILVYSIGIGAARLGKHLDREPLVDRERRERDEDRLQPPVRDEHPVESPAAAPISSTSSVQPTMLAAPVCMCVAASAFADVDHPADGQVDAAREDDDALPDGDEDESASTCSRPTSTRTTPGKRCSCR